MATVECLTKAKSSLVCAGEACTTPNKIRALAYEIPSRLRPLDISFSVPLRSGTMWHDRYMSGGQTATGRPCRFTCIWTLSILLLAFRTVAVADETLIPPDWQPSLSATVAKCKAELEPRQGHRPSQRELNDIASRLAEVQDAELFVTYVRLLGTLDATQRRKLFREQQQWLQDRETKAAAQVQSKGGSLETLEYSGAFIDLTAKRITELRRRMPAASTKR